MLVETIVGLLLVPSWAGGLDFTMTASIPATSFSPFQASLPATALNSFAPFQVSAPASIPTSAPRAAPVSAPASVPALPPSVLAFLQASVPAPPFSSLPPLTAPTPAPLGISLFQDAPIKCVKCGDACKLDGLPGLTPKDSNGCPLCPVCVSCNDNSHCTAGKICVNGKCAAGTTCSSSSGILATTISACPSGYRCMNGQCQVCPAVICANPNCPGGTAGTTTSVDVYGCPGCPKCADVCTENANCPRGQRCFEGKCITRACDTNSNCPGKGHRCVNGQCTGCRTLPCFTSICTGTLIPTTLSNGCRGCPRCVLG